MLIRVLWLISAQKLGYEWLTRVVGLGEAGFLRQVDVVAVETLWLQEKLRFVLHLLEDLFIEAFDGLVDEVSDEEHGIVELEVRVGEDAHGGVLLRELEIHPNHHRDEVPKVLRDAPSALIVRSLRVRRPAAFK